MNSVNIDQLFDRHRFPPVSFGLVALVVYLPIGFILAFLRTFIGLHAFIVSCVLPKAWYLRRIVGRVMCTILGIIVVQDNSEVRDCSARVIVANYTTPMDRVAVELVYPNVMTQHSSQISSPLRKGNRPRPSVASADPSMWDLPAALMWLLGYEDMGAKQGRETLVQNAKRHCQESPYPLLAFPEGATTNGKVGLLKFSVWPFSLDERVQPILINISRPLFTAVSPSVAGSWWWTDIFWFLFVPYSCFSLRILPVMTQLEDETMQEFAVRVQKTIAKAMSVEPTPYTSADKIEYIKRIETTQGQLHRQDKRTDQHAQSSTPINSEMELLVSQVKQVLPHVPVPAIRQDLHLTKDVDLTITNILEGKVLFTAEEPAVEADRMTSPVQHVSKPVPKSSQNVNVKTSTNSSSFGRTTTERHMTFAERKKALIESARQRYLEKHNLSNTASTLHEQSS